MIPDRLPYNKYNLQEQSRAVDYESWSDRSIENTLFSTRHTRLREETWVMNLQWGVVELTCIEM